MTWKIVLILAAVVWRGQAQFLGVESCSVRASHIDSALAALLENLPGEFEITDGREVRIYPGLSLGRTYLRGLKQMDSVKPYLVYCNQSGSDATVRVNVEFKVDHQMEIAAPLNFCASEAVLRTRLLDGRFIVVFEVEKSEDHSGVLLRAKELRPVWMEKFTVRLEGLGPAVSAVSSVIGVLFSQVARYYWALVLENYGPRALRAVSQQL